MAAKYDLSQSYLVAVAFDFGTTYSGYAFSLRDKPEDIIINQSWVAGSDKLISLKTPTCVLLDPQKKFAAFGYEAENRYGDLVEDDEHHGYYLFRRFKMALYANEEITKDTMIEDISGKKLPALTVFSHAIRYLYDHFWKSLEDKSSGVLKSDVKYVLTVPAIWNDKAKQFMRKACTEAGIPSDQLRMAFEPEAASVWCQTLTDQQVTVLSATGSKYMVVDLGGGTADITVNEKKDDGTLEELHKASGGPWGGTEVDKAYIVFLTSIFGEDTMSNFKKKYLGDYFNILRNFETKKRSISSQSADKVTFWIPVSLTRLFEKKGVELEERLKLRQFMGVTSPSGDKLRIQKTVIENWFKPTLDHVTNHVKNLLHKPSLRDVSCILLVGGFAECDIVKDAFRRSLAEKKFILPPDAGLVVLKGAVRFGHKPGLIAARKSKFIYGSAICPKFSETLHRQEKKIVVYGEEWCNDVFSKLVSIGDILNSDNEFKQERNAMHVDQTNGSISLYCSEQNDPMYVTDPGCVFLGNIVIDLPDAETIEEKNHCISIIFWDTEIRVKVKIYKTGKVYEETFNSI